MITGRYQLKINRGVPTLRPRSDWDLNCTDYAYNEDFRDTVRYKGFWYAVKKFQPGIFVPKGAEPSVESKWWTISGGVDYLYKDSIQAMHINAKAITAEKLNVESVQSAIVTAEAIEALTITTGKLNVTNDAKIGEFTVKGGFLVYENDDSSIYIGDFIPGQHAHSCMFSIKDSDNIQLSKTSVVIECEHPTKYIPYIPIQDIALKINKGSVVIPPTSKMDIPGVLFAGNIRLVNRLWTTTYKFGRGGRGELNKESPFGLTSVNGGNYTILHELGHLNYTVFVTPIRSGSVWNKVNWHIEMMTRKAFTIRFTDSGTDNTDVQSDFSFVVIGDNTI